MKSIIQYASATALFASLTFLMKEGNGRELYFLILIACVLLFLGVGPSILMFMLSFARLMTSPLSAGRNRVSEVATLLCGVALFALLYKHGSKAVSCGEEAERLQQLRHSKERLLLVIDTIPAMVWCANAGGGPAFVNKRMAEFVGVSEKEFVESLTRPAGSFDVSIAWWRQLIHPDDYEGMRSIWTRSLATGQSYRSTYRMRRTDSTYRWVQSMGEPIRNEDGVITCWYGINIDIDDARRNEEKLSELREQLSRTMQLAVIAELSASIAHEINQPLAAIVANGQACQHWISASPPNLKRVHLSVERIVRDCQGTADIVSRIRALFKKASPEKVWIDINEVLQEVLRLVRDRTRRNNVKIETSFEMELPRVLADRVQVQQLVMNLVLNAIDAMSLEPEEFKVLATSSRSRSDGLVEVTVKDFGCGLPSEKKIFEPFYTTKEQGMGMGLAICKTIAEQHGGSLSVYANPVRGATFAFTLPMSDNASSTVEARFR